MIWIILCIIIGIVAGIFTAREECLGCGEGILVTLGMTFITTLFGFVISVLCSEICSNIVSVKYVKTETIEISALKDNTSSSAQFFLGSGCVDEEMRYFYIKNTEIGKKMDSIGAENAYIKENNTENPRIETWKPEYENWAWNLIAFPCFKNTRFQIYIPEGSVTTDFDIDMEDSSTNRNTITTTSDRSVVCQNCNQNINTAFCPNCGWQAPIKKYCTSCGSSYEDSSAKFCADCGTSLS